MKKNQILAIDDDEWFLRLLIKKFKDIDLSLCITPVYSASEAILKLEKKEYDCILCDHKLSGTLEIEGRSLPSNGIYLLKKLTLMGIDTPVIFVTGQGSEEIASEALQLGASGYFIKRVQPSYFSLMATSIKQTIERSRVQKDLLNEYLKYRDLYEKEKGKLQEIIRKNIDKDEATHQTSNIFISYSRNDFAHAKKIYDRLTSIAEFNVWIDSENLLPGEEWEERIRQVISESDFVIIIISKNLERMRGFYQKEIRITLEELDLQPPGKIFAIPILIEASEIRHPALTKLHHVEFYNDWEKGFDKLIQSLGTKMTLNDVKNSII